MSHTEQFCHKEVAEDPPPLFQNGNINFQVHHIGWIISGTFAIISTGVSIWLIKKHLQWYTNKREQRYIVRLLFMVPLYAIVSFASFVFWNQSTPIILVRDAYEAIVLTAFFYLLLMYLSDDVEEQKRILLKKGLSKEADRVAVRRGLPVVKWVFPIGFVKWKPKDGLYFLQLMKWGVLQYCVIRPTTTLAAVVLDYMGLYCESSWGLGWGHIYNVLIVSVSVTIAMYCLIQLYVCVSKELAEYQPLLKLFSVKAVVFLTFWQATFLSVLSMLGVIKHSKYMTAEDINIGIGALLETLEMMLFAILHIKAFTYKPYRLATEKASKGLPPTQTPQWRSLGHAMDFRETFREIWDGCIYMFDKVRGKEPKPDFGAKREAHYEAAFGRSRLLQVQILKDNNAEKEHQVGGATLPSVEIEIDEEVQVDIEGQRQWLGLGKHDRYGLHPQREKSEGFQEQIDHELERLGYPKLDRERFRPEEVHTKPRERSWWRNLYSRVSQTGHEMEGEQEKFIPRRSYRRPSYRNHLRTEMHLPDIDRNIDDHPPRSVLYPSKARRPGGIVYQDYGEGPSSVKGHSIHLAKEHNYRPLNYHHDPFGTGPKFPESGQRPSRPSPSSPISSLQDVDVSRRAISPSIQEEEAYGASGPTSPRRSPGNRLTSGDSRNGPRPPRSSYIPPRDSLVFPSPLNVHHRLDFGVRQGQHLLEQWSHDVRPPPTPPKIQSQSMLQSFPDEPCFIPHRNSIHRREPASVPLSPHQEHQPSVSSPPLA